MTDAERTNRRWLRVAILIAAAGALWRSRIATWPLERLVSTFVADDAFYYTQIALHWLQGLGPTFDGVAPTNGFHPLWMLFTIIAQSVAGPDPEHVLRVLLAVSSVCAFGSMALVIRLIDRRVAPNAPGAAALGALFLAFNPYVVGMDMMGVEAPLAALCGLLALVAYERYLMKGGLAPALLTGVACGFAFLARTDLGLLGTLISLDMIRRLARRNTSSEKSSGRPDNWKPFIIFVAAALLIALPWLLWNLAHFGTIWQDSGRVLLYRQHAIEAETGQGGVGYLLRCVGFGFRDYGLRLMGIPSLFITAAISVVGFVFLFMAQRRGMKTDGRFPCLYGVFALGIWFFYVLIFRQQKYWYFPPVTIAAAFFSARLYAVIGATFVQRPLAGKILSASLALVIAASFALSSRKFYESGFHPWQSSYLQVARDMEAGLIPGLLPDDKIGAFNAGILGAFAQKTVINLDGVVHPPIIAAMRQGRFMSYARSVGVDVIVDHQGLIETYAAWSQNDPPTRFAILARYSGVSVGGDYVIVRILDQNP